MFFLWVGSASIFTICLRSFFIFFFFFFYWNLRFFVHSINFITVGWYYRGSFFVHLLSSSRTGLHFWFPFRLGFAESRFAYRFLVVAAMCSAPQAAFLWSAFWFFMFVVFLVRIPDYLRAHFFCFASYRSSTNEPFTWRWCTVFLYYIFSRNRRLISIGCRGSLSYSPFAVSIMCGLNLLDPNCLPPRYTLVCVFFGGDFYASSWTFFSTLGLYFRALCCLIGALGKFFYRCFRDVVVGSVLSRGAAEHGNTSLFIFTTFSYNVVIPCDQQRTSLSRRRWAFFFFLFLFCRLIAFGFFVKRFYSSCMIFIFVILQSLLPLETCPADCVGSASLSLFLLYELCASFAFFFFPMYFLSGLLFCIFPSPFLMQFFSGLALFISTEFVPITIHCLRPQLGVPTVVRVRSVFVFFLCLLTFARICLWYLLFFLPSIMFFGPSPFN